MISDGILNGMTMKIMIYEDNVDDDDDDDDANDDSYR